jgi:hypothetical protein
MMRATRLWILLFILPDLAAAQVVEIGTSLLTSASASTPGGCSMMDGGAGFTEATASCAAMGYLGDGSAASSLFSSPAGGSVSVFAVAAATSTGSPSNLTASGQGDSHALVTWQLFSSYHYSLSTSLLDSATASLSGTSGALPASGVLTPDFYTLRADGTAFALAQDQNGAETITQGPLAASASVTFAAVGSSTLIRGSVLACGVPVQGLLIEALSGESVVASTVTGDDGSYLLPGLPGAVTLRISDPNGVYATEISASLTPPLTFDADLPKHVPALPAPFGGLAALMLASAAYWSLRRRFDRTDLRSDPVSRSPCDP